MIMALFASFHVVETTLDALQLGTDLGKAIRGFLKPLDLATKESEFFSDLVTILTVSSSAGQCASLSG